MQCTAHPTRLYRALLPEDREEIMIGLRQKESLRCIAERLMRNVSVISREIKNNKTEDGRYHAYWATNRSERRRRTSRRGERLADPEVRRYVHEKLPLGWSPQQIAGRLPVDMPGKRVSHETIYQYVFKTERSLTKYLVCGRKNRHKRVHKRAKRFLIPQRTGIEQRPAHITDRTQPGHWEGDTAVSRQSKEALMVLHERAIGLTLLAKLPRCAPEQMNAAVSARLEKLPEALRRSITFDNGQENRRHYQLRDALNIDTYFCNPYRSWEKGSVENTVGLTRRAWPKRTDYALISDNDIAMLEYRLNTRPRKRFGYRTPLELLASVALTP